ncbi:glutamate--cysteine ligase [Acidiferrimicrobium sp. IK]|uniref:carboxylate-amine ligase n=1 Tax=Acidiferrimicrobium sp. IK TaxID=2871700 RepID=UPI0021CB64C3|nr:glutamate--cysteine ligase [Acidiferrimicrobium sp. IK]MCU4184967.1 glutamate--cysteine ligase [Acidiferrimicrobium sp. IK]
MPSPAAPSDDDAWRLGVEEEYLLVDRGAGDLRQDSATVRRVVRSVFGEDIDPELLRSQVEVATPVCATIEDAATHLIRLREQVGAAAGTVDCHLVAVGSHPTARWADQEVTDKTRYHDLERAMAQVALETVICGLHVHVGVPDPDDRIRALNATRGWLGPLLALSASSPYWEGRDTGFASFRTPVFRRWPQTGVPHAMTDWADFAALVDALVAAGAVDDGTNLYWDLRPSVRFPTVELRVADACPRLDDGLTVASLARAVVRAALDPACTPPSKTADLRTEVLEAAVRGAARHGLNGELISPRNGRLAPAREVVGELLDWCGPALDASGDRDRAENGVDRILTDGNSADRQRRAYAERESFADVVALLAAETAGSA